MIELLVATFGVLLGFPLGAILAKITKEELKLGQKWFKILIFLGLISSIFGLILKNDSVLFFSLFFMAVTSQSLSKKKK